VEWLSAAEGEALFLSLKVALGASFIGLPVATALAYLLARKKFRGRILVDLLVHAPLVLPPVVIGYFLLLLFSPVGAIGSFLANSFGLTLIFSWYGAALASLIMALPLMVRAIRLSFEAQDLRLEGAASTLGAGRLKILWTITLPLALPGIVVGTLLGFARALGEFGATITFVSNIPGLTRTLPLALYSAIQTPDGDAIAIRLMLISLALAFAALILSEWSARKLFGRNGGRS
jgi:molybdate transport system permease protein